MGRAEGLYFLIKIFYKIYMQMVLVYFTSGGCVDDVVNNRANHQFTSVIVVHFMNSARVCWIIRRAVFNVRVCLNHSWRYEHNQFKRHDEKPRHQREIFQNLVILYLSVFRKW